MDEVEPTKEILSAELDRRLEQYRAVCGPGCEDSLVPRLTFKQYLPAVVISIVLTVLVFVVGVIYYA